MSTNPKITGGAPYERPYRSTMRILFFFVNFSALLAYVTPALFMTNISETFNTDLATAGLSMTITLVVAGVFFLVGAFIIDKWGMLKTQIISLWLVFAGTLICAFAPSITVFIIARILNGAGFGLTVGAQGFINTWFKDKERTAVLTLFNIGPAIGMAISNAVAIPIATALGNWQSLFYVFAAVNCIIAVAWTALGKNSPEGEELELAQKNTVKEKKSGQSSLVMALKEGQYWLLLVYALTIVIVDTARATYLPTFLMDTGMPQVTTGLVTSLFSIAGMIGALLGGVLVAKFWCRKATFIIGPILYLVAGVLLTFIPGTIGRAILVVLLGFAYNLPTTSQQTVTIEYAIQKGKPEMIPGAFALTGGFGLLLTLIVTPIFTGVSAAAGDLTGAFRIFFACYLIGVIAIIAMKETGKKPDAKANDTKEEK